MLGNNPSIEDVKNFYEKFVSHLKLDLSGKNARLTAIKKFIDTVVCEYKFNSALDVGCGIGITTEHLLKYIPNVTGIDISEANIEVAKSIGKAKYICQNFCDYDTDDKFDLICLFDVVEHIRKDDRDDFFSKIYKFCNGIIISSIPNPIKLENLRIKNPKILQIVDEPVYDSDLKMFNILGKIDKGLYIYYKLNKNENYTAI